MEALASAHATTKWLDCDYDGSTWGCRGPRCAFRGATVDAVRIMRGRQFGPFAFSKARGLSRSTSPRSPSSLYLSSLCEHFRMLGPRLRWVAAVSAIDCRKALGWCW
jgi:hypothetical protein